MLKLAVGKGFGASFDLLGRPGRVQVDENLYSGIRINTVIHKSSGILLPAFYVLLIASGRDAVAKTLP